MENSQQNKGRQEQDQGLQRGQSSDNNMMEQQNNESLNTASQQPVQNLRDGEVGSGRSYDYGASSSPEQGIEGDAASE